jgi:NAD(P)-dependent dehydrogenase (short-subunit alcohol dehydrogenase family)
MDSFNPFSLKSKNILITGASSGIGRRSAIICSQMGARVILIGRRKEKLLETIRLLPSGCNLYYSFDVTNYQEIESVIADAVSKVGLIHGFIHSAGIELTLPFSVTKPIHYQRLFATNAIAGFEFAKELSKKKYIASEGGSFVFISSIMGIVGNSSLVGYSASKGALISGVKSMALELASKNIRVNVISPGHLRDTEMSTKLFEALDKESKDLILNAHPLGLGSTSDVANCCIYLLSDASKWVTGANLIIDGGYNAK